MTDREREIHRLREKGLSCAKIGKIVGLSGSQVERILGIKPNTQRRYNGHNPAKTPLDPDKCGTAAQARAHQRRGEKPCILCSRALSLSKGHHA